MLAFVCIAKIVRLLALEVVLIAHSLKSLFGWRVVTLLAILKDHEMLLKGLVR